MRSLALAFALLAAPAFAQEPVRCPLTGCPVAVPGAVPTGATGIEWCADYLETPLAPTCDATGVVAGRVFNAHDGYPYSLRFRWRPVGEWSEAASLFLETLPEDVSGDGIVGAPDFKLFVEQSGCDVQTGSGCP